MFQLPCINYIHNIKRTNTMHFNVNDLFYSPCSPQHVAAAVVATFALLT